jgi:pilus assembly protein CpaB
MKRAQVIVLGIAVAAGGVAMYLAGNSTPQEKIVEVPQQVQTPQSTVALNDVLVTAVDVNMGATLAKSDMRWQPWPQEATPVNVVRRSDTPNALDELAGSIARTSFVAGEPVRREKIIRADGSGFLSAILPAGMRAVAITIDSRGSSTAGGFILPNDRVDVIRIYREDEGGATNNPFTSETLLKNIRVLAIGQSIQEKDGQKVVVGETATLELDPKQAEVITLAQKVGQLSLALRSIADANTKVEETVQSKDGSMTIVRYGISRQTTRN